MIYYYIVLFFYIKRVYENFFIAVFKAGKQHQKKGKESLLSLIL